MSPTLAGRRMHAPKLRAARQVRRARASGDGDGGFDVGSAWRKARREMNKQVDFNIEELNRDIRPLPRRPRAMSSVDDIKREESLFLNLWVKEDSFKLGGLLVVGMLFVFAIVSGPPLD